MSRPGRNAAAPGPMYAAAATTTLYCRTCGRVVSSKRPSPGGRRQVRTAQHCSARCKRERPGELGGRIEDCFAAALELDASLAGDDDDDDDASSGTMRGRLEALIAKKKQASATKRKKGDARISVACSDIQAVVFPEDADGEDGAGEDSGGGGGSGGGVSAGAGDDRGDGMAAEEEDNDDDDDDDDDDGSEDGSEDGGVRIPLVVPMAQRAGGAEDGCETRERGSGHPGPEGKQQEGMRRARQKEMVKQAARRLVVFGHYQKQQQQEGNQDDRGGGGHRRLCEALENGKVVEPSFAKGDWAVRWRQE